MKLSNTFPASLLLVALFFQYSVTAFVIAPSQSPQTSSKLFVSTIYSDFSNDNSNRKASRPRLPLSGGDDTVVQDLQAFVAPTAASEAIRSMDLPKHGPSAEQLETAKTLMSLEMLVGRGAMLVAVVLMATELTTGHSLPEQVSAFFS